MLKLEPPRDAGVGDQGLGSPIQVCVVDGSGPARPCSQVCVCGFPCVGQLVQFNAR